MCMFEGENISFDANLYIYIYIYIYIYTYSTNTPTIIIINRIYETQNLLSAWLVSSLVGLRTYQESELYLVGLRPYQESELYLVL